MQRLPLRAHARGRRRRYPRVDGEEPVLLPRGRRGRGRCPPRRAARSSASSQRALVGGAHLGRDRVAQHVRDVAQAGRAADHRPVEEAGAVAVRDVDEEVAHVRVAVHERARARVPQRRRCRRCARGRCRRGGGTPRAAGRRECRRPSARTSPRRRPPPVPFGASQARSPSSSKRGDSQNRACSAASCSTMSRARARDVVVRRVREPAPGRDEVFEHHHVAVAVGVGEPHVRDAHRDLGREVAVEARLGDAHADRRDELALALVERRQLHEHGRRHARVAASAQRGRGPSCPSSGRAARRRSTSRPSAVANHSGVRSATSSGSTGVRLRAPD